MHISRRTSRVAVIVAVVGALVAGALVVLSAGAPQRLAPPAAAAPRAAHVSARAVAPELRRHFAVLHRTRNAADHLGRRTNGIPTADYYAEHLRALTSSSARGAHVTRRASDAFVAPGPGGTLCLLVIPPGFDGPGGTCVSRSEALTGGTVWAVNAGDGRSEIIGLVPNGVRRVRLRSTRAHVTLPVVANSYGALIAGLPRDVSYRETSGKVRRIRFGT